jgi:hypothetical protein
MGPPFCREIKDIAAEREKKEINKKYIVNLLIFALTSISTHDKLI